jgi:hypothetical protein
VTKASQSSGAPAASGSARNPQLALLPLQQLALLGLAALALLALLGRPGLFQGLEHVVERRGVADLHGGQMAHHLIHQPHETAERGGILAAERQAALGQLVEQPPRRVLVVGEEARVVQHELLERGLQALHRALHRRQQARVLGDVLHHPAHHFVRRARGRGRHRGGSRRHAAVPARGHGRRLGGRQAAHQAFELRDVLHGFRCGRRQVATGRRHGHHRRHAANRGVAAAYGVVGERVTPAGQHLPQDTHGEQGLLGLGRQGHACGGRAPARPIAAAIDAARARLRAVGRRRVARSSTAAGIAAVGAARNARSARHRIAHGLHAMLAQALGGALVGVDQQRAQLLAHVPHPELAHVAGHAGLAHHLLQRADVVLGAEGVAFRLHAVQSLRGAHQRVELGQRGLGGMHGDLLRARQLHLGHDVGVVHQGQLAEIHAAIPALARLGLRRPLGEDFQQRRGVALDQRRRMPLELAQRIAHQRTLADVAAVRFLLGQRVARDFDQFPDECLAFPDGIDDACAKNRSGAGRWKGHGEGMQEMGGGSRPMLLPVSDYLSAL